LLLIKLYCTGRPTEWLFAVTALSNVTTVHFSMAAKSHHSAPWRVELVFESPLISTQAKVHRGRAKMDVCLMRGVHRTMCRQWKRVRYRRYDAHGRSYTIFDVTAAVAVSWTFCRPKSCRFTNCLFTKSTGDRT